MWFSCFVLLPLSAAIVQAILVSTSSGPVEGFVGKRGSAVFLGIPYAAPPVGKLRFLPPTLPSPWTKVLNATEAGPPCQQLGGLGMFDVLPPFEKFSEDCLTLNVFTPTNFSASSKLAVLFWIYGGGYSGGSSYTSGFGDLEKLFNITPVYDAQRLVSQHNIVLVSANYRLNSFGFYYDGGKASGFAGLQDQQFALQWVQKNIANFGGDPKRVTVVGESAGGESVVYHLVSPASRGLFSGAIIQSGGIGYRKPSDALAQGQAFASSLNCSSLDCMQNISNISAILNSGKHLSLGPILMGAGSSDLPDTPYNLFKQGKFAQVPVIIGNNRDEESILTQYCGSNVTAADFVAHVQNIYGARAPDVLKMYPMANFPQPRDAFERLESDRWTCESWNVTNLLVNSLNCKVWSYHLERAPWFINILSEAVWGVNESAFCLGVPHATDLVFVFQNFDEHLGSEGKVLDHVFASSWTDLAKTSTSATPSAGGWHPFCQQRTTMVLNDKAAPVPDYMADKCQLLYPDV